MRWVEGFLLFTGAASVLTFCGVWIASAPAVGGPVPPPPSPAETTLDAPGVPSTVYYYSGCREARAAGAAPLHRGDPGYRAEMDGDGDGIACEPSRGSGASVSESGGEWDSSRRGRRRRRG